MSRPARPRKIVPHPGDASLALVPLTKGYFAVISVIDSPAVGRHCWHVRAIPNSTPYAGRSIRRDDGGTTSQSLHRFVGDLMGLSLEHQVDHENGNGLDCRRSNLRDATHTQNTRNARRSRNNTTGVKGVARHRTRPHSPERYVARVMVDRKSIYLGTYDTIAEAQAAVVSARPVLHGDFANHGGLPS